MAYLKDQLDGFVPVEIAAGIVKDVARGSTVMRLSRVEAMTSDTKKFSVMTGGPGAYWVNEAERISTGAATWIHPEMTAKKLAVIVPVTKEKLNDTTINVFAEISPMIAEEFYKKIDNSFLFGATGVVARATAAGNNFARNDANKLDLEIADLMALVEADGYDVSGFVSHIGMKNSLRKLRDTAGNQLFVAGLDQNELYGLPVEFSRNGAFDTSAAELIAGNWAYSVVGIREGITFEVLREATLQNTVDADGKPLSLAEQDMVAIKATMRLGHLVVKDSAFAVMTPDVTP